MDEIRKRGLPSPDRADGLGLRLRLPGRVCSPRRVAPGPEHHRGSDVEGPVTPRRVEDRVISTVDPDAWHGHKTAAHRVRWLQGPDQARAAAPNTAEYPPNTMHARGNRALVIGHRLVTHAAERAAIDPHHLTSSGASAQLRQAVAALASTGEHGSPLSLNQPRAVAGPVEQAAARAGRDWAHLDLGRRGHLSADPRLPLDLDTHDAPVAGLQDEIDLGAVAVAQVDRLGPHSDHSACARSSPISSSYVSGTAACGTARSDIRAQPALNHRPAGVRDLPAASLPPLYRVEAMGNECRSERRRPGSGLRSPRS